jgi:hypothetical protein
VIAFGAAVLHIVTDYLDRTKTESEFVILFLRLLEQTIFVCDALVLLVTVIVVTVKTIKKLVCDP